ncbi:hypothetical protein RCS94_10565 [Orbaceae bacterium ac157xtp]
MGFVVDGTLYSEGIGNINSTDIKEFNAGLKLSDFTVTDLTAADFSVANDYADLDGDVAHPTTPFSMNPRTFEWRDRTDALVSNYNQTLGCGSGLSLPLTLKITLPKVKVRSLYGDPNESSETDLVKTYKIGTATGICFAKPNAMIVKPYETWKNVSSWNWNLGSSVPDTANGGGYDPAQFDPVNGFRANLATKFPTTGFPGASFTLIMTSNASDYTFNSSSSSVTVDANGKVTINSYTWGVVTITATFKNDTSKVHTYTFNPTRIWVVPKGRMTYDYVGGECGGDYYIPERTDLTNSPWNTALAGAPISNNAYTRVVGGGVFNEWGYTARITYPDSQWATGINSYHWYWTREEYSSTYPYRHFIVNSDTGLVSYEANAHNPWVVCLVR